MHLKRARWGFLVQIIQNKFCCSFSVFSCSRIYLRTVSSSSPTLRDLRPVDDTNPAVLNQDPVLTSHKSFSADTSALLQHGICNPILRGINFPSHAHRLILQIYSVAGLSSEGEPNAFYPVSVDTFPGPPLEVEGLCKTKNNLEQFPI